MDLWNKNRRIEAPEAVWPLWRREQFLPPAANQTPITWLSIYTELWVKGEHFLRIQFVLIYMQKFLDEP
jgi:hypothetical protein